MNKKSQNGAAIIELTIVLVFVLIPLLLAVLEFARLMYAYKTLVHQVNHTARYLSVQMPGLNHDKAVCLFKTGKAEVPCSADNDLLKAFADPDFEVLISDSFNSPLHAQWETSTLTVSSHINLVTVRAQNFSYSFDFSKLFGDHAIKFSPVSATYRQVN